MIGVIKRRSLVSMCAIGGVRKCVHHTCIVAFLHKYQDPLMYALNGCDHGSGGEPRKHQRSVVYGSMHVCIVCVGDTFSLCLQVWGKY